MRRLVSAALTAALASTLAVASSSAASAATLTVDRGPSTSLDGPHVAGTRDVAVAGGRTYLLGASTVKVFAAGASGAAAPQRTILLNVPGGQAPVSIAVGSDGTTYVLTGDGGLSAATLFVYGASASGAAVPSSATSNVSLGIDQPIDIAERPGGLAVLDNDSNEIFFLQQAGSGLPTKIGGIDAGSNTRTRIFGPTSIDTAPDGRLVVTGADWVSVFAANAQGDVAPQQYLQGARTRIGITIGAGLDSHGNLYVGSADSWENGAHSRVLRFDRGATGDLAPATVLAGARSGLKLPFVEVLPGGGILRSNVDLDAGGLTGPIGTYRAFGPYAAPAATTRLKASGKARAAKRTLSWRAAAVDADVPVTGYAVKVTCKAKGNKARKVLARSLPASARAVKVKLGKVRKASCTATLSARNALGSGATTRTRFTVKR